MKTLRKDFEGFGMKHIISSFKTVEKWMYLPNQLKHTYTHTLELCHCSLFVGLAAYSFWKGHIILRANIVGIYPAIIMWQSSSDMGQELPAG